MADARWGSWVVGAGSMLIAACGLGFVGETAGPIGAHEGGAGVDGPPSSAPAPAKKSSDTGDSSAASDGGATVTPSPPLSCSTAGDACAASLSAGWEPVLFTTTPTMSCPENFERRDVVMSPSAGAGACSCDCQPSASDPPSCAHGSVAATFGATLDACSDTSASMPVAEGRCVDLGETMPLFPLATLRPPPAHAGSCSITSRKDEAKVTAVSARLCRPPRDCREAVCRGTNAGGVQALLACVAHDGDLPCPAASGASGAPWTHRVVVGQGATLACQGCNTCQTEVTCGAGTLQYFASAGCQATTATRPVDGTCSPPTIAGDVFPVASYRFASATNATCAPGVGEEPRSHVALTGVQTVCCR